MTHVVGVDPGLVHTGVVRLLFNPSNKQIGVSHLAVAGPDAGEVAKWAQASVVHPHIFIEKYQPRSNFSTDPAMTKALVEFKQAMPGAKVLLNTGVKKVVGRPLLELLGLWTFTTRTNHDDLRSAARIALLGMLKDEQMNTLLADVVRDHVAGTTWTVIH